MSTKNKFHPSSDYLALILLGSVLAIAGCASGPSVRRTPPLASTASMRAASNTFPDNSKPDMVDWFPGKPTALASMRLGEGYTTPGNVSLSTPESSGGYSGGGYYGGGYYGAGLYGGGYRGGGYRERGY